ncbi:MAG: TonB-dependent receptor, partial [Bacteroidota bacterium]
LNFGKIRLSAAGVGNDTDPHQLDIVYSNNGNYAGNPRNNINLQRPPADLKPERIRSFETGLDLRLFQNRVNLDLTAYTSRTVNHILAADVSPTSGFSQALINAGETRSAGLEVMLSGELFRTPDFSWTLSGVFTRNRSRVISLADDLENIQLASQWGVTIEARPGNLYGDIVGIAIARDEAGNPLVNAEGLYIKDGFQVLGNTQPDFLAGITNKVRYKNFSLSFLVDIRKGGEMYAATNMYGMGYSGNFVETLEGREAWYASEEARNEAGMQPHEWTATGGFLAEGVYADGTMLDGADVSGQQNGTYMNPETYWAQFSNWGDELHEPHVYDAGFVKLREVMLSYSLPKRVASSIRAQRIQLAFVGRNLWVIHKNVPNIDPESYYSNSNGQGIEYGSYPTTRSLGVDIKIDW